MVPRALTPVGVARRVSGGGVQRCVPGVVMHGMAAELDSGGWMQCLRELRSEVTQLRGEVADHRSDIFNLGAILYEMLAGQRLFLGTSTSEVLNAVRGDEPIEIPEGNGKFDPALVRLLCCCLEKNPGERIQSARDLAFDLETLLLPNDKAPRTRWKAPRIAMALIARWVPSSSRRGRSCSPPGMRR